MAEFPDGLAVASSDDGGSVTLVNLPYGNGLPPGGHGSPPPKKGTGGGWNFPGIYQSIASQGQTIVSQNIFMVYGQEPGWTDSHIVVKPNEIVWIDTHSDGAWGNQTAETAYNMNNYGSPTFGANGLGQNSKGMLIGTTSGGAADWGCLMGFTGGVPPTTPTSPNFLWLQDLGQQSSGSFSIEGCFNTASGPQLQPPVYPGQAFFVGQTLTNYGVQPGPLNFTMNNVYQRSLGTGKQVVRVIVTTKTR